MSTSKHNPKAEKSRARLYTVLGIVIALLVAALLIWNSRILDRGAAAATIGEETFNVAEVDFFYYTAKNEAADMASMYAQYGLNLGYDPNKSDALQMFDEETTYQERFLDTALNQLRHVTVLTDLAEQEGYTLSEEGQESYERSLAETKSQITYASLMRRTSESSYIKARFGPHANMRMLEEIIKDQALASDYATYRFEQLNYSDEEIEAYYLDHTDDLDTFSYRTCFIPAEPEVSQDENGDDLEATEEQVAAAMEQAKADADAMVSRVRRGQDFNTVALDYVGEEEQESYSNPDYGYSGNVFGSEISAQYQEWFTEDGRRVGDVGAYADEDAGYYVIQLLDRERLENSYQNADVWSVLVMAETTDTTDEEGNVTASLPTEEQLNAAYAAAEALQGQWLLSSSARSEESFQALVPASDGEEDADEEADADEAKLAPEVQILTEATRGRYGADFDQFVFTPGVVPGTAGIVEVYDNANNVIGYRFVYINSFGLPLWKGTALDTLRNADFDLWYTEQEAKYEITRLDGISKVGR